MVEFPLTKPMVIMCVGVPPITKPMVIMCVGVPPLTKPLVKSFWCAFLTSTLVMVLEFPLTQPIMVIICWCAPISQGYGDIILVCLFNQYFGNHGRVPFNQTYIWLS